MVEKVKRLLYTIINRKLYISCEELPFYNFIKCLVNGDLAHLRGYAPDRKKAWETVFNEYLTLSSGGSANQYLSILKDVYTITYKLIIVETVVNAVSLKYHPVLVQRLRSLGFRFQYEEGENLQKELAATISQCKSQLVTLHQRKQELTVLERAKGKAATENDYWDQLSELSKFQTYHLNAKNITVSEYCAILRRFKEANRPR